MKIKVSITREMEVDELELNYLKSFVKEGDLQGFLEDTELTWEGKPVIEKLKKDKKDKK